MSEIEELIEQSKHDGFLLRKTLRPNDKAASGCWFGGEPTLPPEIEWPYTQSKEFPPIPLHFAAQIDLSAIPLSDKHPEMPRTGTLFFFIDPIYGPAYDYSQNTTRVIYVAGDVSKNAPRQMPPLTMDAVKTGYASRSYGRPPIPKIGFRRWNVNFEPRISYDVNFFEDPDYEDPDAQEQAITLGVKERKRIRAIINKDAFDAQQNNGLKVTNVGMHSMFSGPNSPGSMYMGSISHLSEMVPLLALKDDSDLSMNFSGHEWAVFWIKPDALRNGDFDRAWVSEGRG
jgi:uncharacterized protein YwqG